MPHSGWPIDYDTLHPYYLRAMKLWETGVDSLDIMPWVSDERKLLAFKNDALETKLYMTGSQAVLTQGIGGRVKESKNIRLIMKANAVELDTNENASTVTGVKVACLDGRRFTVTARQVILAQGGFQVPRLLLASDRVARDGLGNDHGLVGRFLMDRQIVKTGILYPNDPISRFGLYDLQHRGIAHVLGKLAIPQRTLEEKQLMNVTVGLNAQPAFSRVRLAQRLFGRGTTFRSPAYYSLRKLMRDVRARRMPERPLHHLGRVLGGLDDLVFIKVARAPWLQIPYNRDSGGWYEAPHRDQFFKVIDLYQIAEQSPDPDNRITLSSERDATGMRRPTVHFRWRDLDIRSALGSQEIVKNALEEAGIGRVLMERRDGMPLVTQMTAHHRRNDPHGRRAHRGRGGPQLPRPRGGQPVCSQQRRLYHRRLRAPDADHRGPDRAHRRCRQGQSGQGLTGGLQRALPEGHGHPHPWPFAYGPAFPPLASPPMPEPAPVRRPAVHTHSPQKPTLPIPHCPVP